MAKRVTETEAREMLANSVEFVVGKMLQAEIDSSEVDWADEAHDGIGNCFLYYLEGDQNIAWRTVRAVDADVARLGEVWVGEWPRLSRRAFEGLISAAVQEGILEDRRGVLRGRGM